MTTKLLETKVRQLPGMAIVDLQGEINAFADQAIDSAYAQASIMNPGYILLNFKGVDYINSTGIALIVSLLAQARQSDCKLIVCGLSDHYQEIFEITRLVDFMDIYPDESTAIKEAMAKA